MKTEEIVRSLRCSSRVPGPQLDCRTCSYHMEETVDGVDYAGCDCDRIAMDAADRLEELVERCARYAEEIAVLREWGKRAVEDASPYAAAAERQDVGGGVLDVPGGKSMQRVTKRCNGIVAEEQSMKKQNVDAQDTCAAAAPGAMTVKGLRVLLDAAEAAGYGDVPLEVKGCRFAEMHLRVETLIGAEAPGTLVELMATPAES